MAIENPMSLVVTSDVTIGAILETDNSYRLFVGKAQPATYIIHYGLTEITADPQGSIAPNSLGDYTITALYNLGLTGMGRYAFYLMLQGSTNSTIPSVTMVMNGKTYILDYQETALGRTVYACEDNDGGGFSYLQANTNKTISITLSIN